MGKVDLGSDAQPWCAVQGCQEEAGKPGGCEGSREKAGDTGCVLYTSGFIRLPPESAVHRLVLTSAIPVSVSSHASPS